MRFSLRELFAVATIACLAVPALLFASTWVKVIAIGLVIVAGLVALDVVVVHGGKRRVIAIGWLLPTLIYGGLVYRGGIDEKNPYSGRLWTTKLMAEPLRWATKPRSYFVEIASGKKHKEMPANAVFNTGGGFGGGGAFGGAPAAPLVMVEYHQIPDQQDFMPIAHCLWTLLFGYAGAKYAAWVYDRRVAQESTEGADA